MKSLFAVIIAFFLFSACKKRVFDYRNEYLGEYNFSGSNYRWNPIYGNSDTTYFSNVVGKLTYNKKGEKDKMNLFIKDQVSLEFTINKSAEISLCSGNGEIDEEYNFSVSFDKFICDYGKPQLGGKHIYTIRGEKK